MSRELLEASFVSSIYLNHATTLKTRDRGCVLASRVSPMSNFFSVRGDYEELLLSEISRNLCGEYIGEIYLSMLRS